MFPDDAKPAVEMAVDIWAQSIETVIPIQMQAIWDSLPPTCWPNQHPMR